MAVERTAIALLENGTIAAPSLTLVVRRCYPLTMNIPLEFATHEAGHLVVGLRIGLVEQGIVFRPVRPGEAAQAVYTFTDPQTSLVRSFGGLLAHLHVLPDTLEPHLRLAYAHSIIFTPDHPHYNALTKDERTFLSGAQTDMALARSFAGQIMPADSASVIQRMRAAEVQARDLITASAHHISLIAADIIAFGLEPDSDEGHFVHYSVQRANELIRNA